MEDHQERERLKRKIAELKQQIREREMLQTQLRQELERRTREQDSKPK